MDLMRHCTLCPRRCGADRMNGMYGFCGAGSDVRIARAALHFWEEPCISGKNGSGTVFFSHCTMKCVYCQNYEVSTHGLGYDATPAELADTFLRLQSEGAENINLVTPTHYVPQIIDALDIAKANGLKLPVVYNTGGYETEETIEMLNGYVDIYMPDFKYFNEKTAVTLSSAPHYPNYAKRSIAKMFGQTGKPVFDDRGIMRRGMIVRHLMLPGFLMDTIHIIDYLACEYGNDIYFSLMSQYTPIRHFENLKKLNGRLDMRCYDTAVNRCIELGMKNVFIQEGEAASESFIPEFSGNKLK